MHQTQGSTNLTNPNKENREKPMTNHATMTLVGSDETRPATYMAMKSAISECLRVDEVKEWRSRAAAIREYARQRDDRELETMARRIQGRAVRRIGELMAAVDGRGGDRKSEKIKSGVGPTFDSKQPTRAQVAEDAGLTKHQQWTATRVARIPEPTFEEAIESDTPPSVTKLAQMGQKPREPRDPPTRLEGIDPEHFRKCLHIAGEIRSLGRQIGGMTFAEYMSGIRSFAKEEARQDARRLFRWLEEA